MANRIVQAIYDLKDNVSGKLAKISDALRGHGKAADETARTVEKDNKRVSESYSKTATAIGKFRGALDGLVGVGRKLAKITGISGALAAIVGAFSGFRDIGSAVQSAQEFEQAITEVGAISGATAAQLQRLKAAAESAGEAYGYSAQQSAAALGELARASGDADAAIAQLPATLALAKAGGIDLANAATIVVQTLSQFQLAASQSARVADVITETANATTASVESIGNAMSYAGPLAQQLGFSIEDTAAAIGQLAQNGFQDERADTALRNVFQSLLDPASQFGSAVRTLGIDTTSFSSIVEGLAKSGARGRAAILQLNAQAVPAILGLVSSGTDGLAKLRASLDEVAGSADTTARQFADTFSGAKARLAAAFDSLRRGVVDTALGPLKKAFDDAAVGIRNFISSADFDSLKAAVGQFTTDAIAGVTRFIKSIDFTAAVKRIDEFLTGSGKKLGDFFTAVGDNAGKISKVFDAVGVGVDGVKTAVFGAATVVSGFAEGAVKAFAGPIKRLTDLHGGFGRVNEAAAKLDEVIGGLGAVTDEFARRTADAAHDVAGAFDDTADSAASAAASTQQATDATADLLPVVERLTVVNRDAASAQDAVNKAQQRAAADAAALQSAYTSLGIKSQQDLDAAASNARQAFEIIAEAAQNNTATLSDVQRAFDAYAASMRASAAGAAPQVQQQTNALLQQQQVALGLADTTQHTADVQRNASQQNVQSQQQQTNAVQQTSAEIERMGDLTVEVAHSTGGAVAGITEAYTAARKSMQETGDAAVAMFDELVVKASQTSAALVDVFGPATITGGPAQALAAIQFATEKVNGLVAEQRDRLQVLADEYTTLGQTGESSMLRVDGNIDQAITNLQRMSASAVEGNAQFSLLGDQDLSKLRSAADSAIAKLQQMRDAAKQANEQLADLGNDLRDQIDQLQGDDSAVETRRYEEQLAQIKELAQASGDANSEEYRQAVANANKLHALKMQQLREQAAEAKASTSATESASAGSSRAGKSSGGGATTTARTEIALTLDGKNLGTVDPNNAAQLQQLAQALVPELVRQIRQAARAAGGRAF